MRWEGEITLSLYASRCTPVTAYGAATAAGLGGVCCRQVSEHQSMCQPFLQLPHCLDSDCSTVTCCLGHQYNCQAEHH